MNYFEARAKREKKIEQIFRDLAQELKELGCEVFAPKSKPWPILFIHVRKQTEHGIQHVGIQWQRLPHSWESYVDLDPKYKRGGSKGLKTIPANDSDERYGIWSAEQIVNELLVGSFTADKYYLEKL
jgi:hypothetical protein